MVGRTLLNYRVIIKYSLITNIYNKKTTWNINIFFLPLLKLVCTILCHVYCYVMYKFEGKNNRHFCYNNWRHVGEHAERNLLSIRRSPCNERSTCWSVLMYCKKLPELHFEKKSLYSTYSSFLIINVCNQGKTLCSPCIIISSTIKRWIWEGDGKN
jgi:hypothetical protein